MALAAAQTTGATMPNTPILALNSNNTILVLGATTTRFYGIDYDLDTLVTIQPATPGGGSATGGSVLQTLRLSVF